MEILYEKQPMRGVIIFDWICALFLFGVMIYFLYRYFYFDHRIVIIIIASILGLIVISFIFHYLKTDYFAIYNQGLSLRTKNMSKVVFLPWQEIRGLESRYYFGIGEIQSFNFGLIVSTEKNKYQIDVPRDDYHRVREIVSPFANEYKIQTSYPEFAKLVKPFMSQALWAIVIIIVVFCLIMLLLK